MGKRPLFLISTEGMTSEEMHPAGGRKLRVEDTLPPVGRPPDKPLARLRDYDALASEKE